MPQTFTPKTASFDPKTLLNLSPEQIYDAIMREIEPDLTTDRQPGLETAYAGEAPEQTAERFERYARAYQEYDTRYAAYKQQLSNGMHSYLRASMRAVEGDDRTNEETTLSTIESSITAA